MLNAMFNSLGSSSSRPEPKGLPLSDMDRQLEKPLGGSVLTNNIVTTARTPPATTIWKKSAFEPSLGNRSNSLPPAPTTASSSPILQQETSSSSSSAESSPPLPPPSYYSSSKEQEEDEARTTLDCFVSAASTASTTPAPSMLHIDLKPSYGDVVLPSSSAAATALLTTTGEEMKTPKSFSSLDHLLGDLPCLPSSSHHNIDVSGLPQLPPPTPAPSPASGPPPRGVTRYATMPVMLSSDFAFRTPMPVGNVSITPQQMLLQNMQRKLRMNVNASEEEEEEEDEVEYSIEGEEDDPCARTKAKGTWYQQRFCCW
eukprot:GHVS01078155.1.p1 GENE.GHVS01078155.1~~GHVS01078155.1.p1  ORF type:complete len:314 (+),score=98.90 GHVS01078155.1:201-1142(+)